MALERTAPLASTAYRPDIDGLRTVAVLPVVLFHAGVGLFSGGYVGVDIFFVISGYLITNILAHEMAEGRYSILEFYRRRARRIFPALVVVGLCTLVLGYAVLAPDALVDLGKSAVAIALFASNVFFWKSVGYFEAGNAIKPLLHTWSLAVEEQFYIVFPLLLWPLRSHRKYLLTALWIGAAASLAVAVVLVPWKPSAAFYLPMGRAWELLVGGLIAVGAVPAVRSAAVREIAGWSGVALIAAPMLLYTAATPFPGWAAVPPCVGAGLLIWSGGAGTVSRLLGTGPMVAVGKMSYSLYLWHLPVLEFGKYLYGAALPIGAALGLSLLSLGLAALSLRFIERPFRHSRPPARANRLAGIAFVLLGLFGLTAFAIVAADGVPRRIGGASAMLLDAAKDKQRHHAECLSVGDKNVPPEQACHLGAEGAPAKVLLWGDSHAMVTATAMEQAARRRGAAFLFAADADCPIGLDFAVDQSVGPSFRSDGHYRFCEDYNRRMLAVAMRPEIQTVVLSARWTNWRIGAPPGESEGAADLRLIDRDGLAGSIAANRAKALCGLQELLAKLRAAGKRVVIVGPVPEPAADVPHRLFVEQFGIAPKSGPVTIAQFRARHAVMLAYFDRLSHQPGIRIIHPETLLCQRNLCPIVEGGRPLFLDQDHLSLIGAAKTSPLYDGVF